MGLKSRVGALAGSMPLSLMIAPLARSQSVDDKIKSLEQELMQLKTEQVELRKEATAAAAPLPT